MQRAARLVEQLGLPLELDTDGIWCALPASFPETFEVRWSHTCLNHHTLLLRIYAHCKLLAAPAAAQAALRAILHDAAAAARDQGSRHQRPLHDFARDKLSASSEPSCLLQLRRRGAKPLHISYPCMILNVMVAAHNTNDQYQDLVDPETRKYSTSSQMSIEFEVDGPYKASPAALNVLHAVQWLSQCAFMLGTEQHVSLHLEQPADLACRESTQPASCRELRFLYCRP